MPTKEAESHNVERDVLVTGHRNPDTDSICAAISYARLKNKINKTKNYIACRAGNLNAETSFVLQYFKEEKPRLLESVKTQVSDVAYRKTAGVPKNMSLKQAYQIMRDSHVVTLPAVTEDGILEGLITISDIADDCGMNRMTFYYHFQDIYDLIDWSFAEEAEKILAGKKSYETWQEGYLQLFLSILENKPLIMNVYRTVSREQLEQYLFKVSYRLLRDVVEEEDKERVVREEDKDFIANFYKYAYVGLILDWIRGDMKENPEKIISRMSLLMQGNFARALEAYAEEQIAYGKNKNSHKFYWEKPIRRKMKPIHPRECDESLPVAIRGKHFNSWTELASELGYHE